jgi:hypothetical protein
VTSCPAVVGTAAVVQAMLLRQVMYHIVVVHRVLLHTRCTVLPYAFWWIGMSVVVQDVYWGPWWLQLRLRVGRMFMSSLTE